MLKPWPSVALRQSPDLYRSRPALFQTGWKFTRAALYGGAKEPLVRARDRWRDQGFSAGEPPGFAAAATRV